MRRLTPYGAKIIGRLLGFRHFIQTAEMAKLNMLIDENPKYFYNILPYAEVLGLSNRWAKNFTDLKVGPPTWYKETSDNSAFNVHKFITYLHQETDSQSTASTAANGKKKKTTNKKRPKRNRSKRKKR